MCTARRAPSRRPRCRARRPLPRRVVDGRRYALFLGRNGVHDGRSRRRNAQADAGAGDQDRPDEIDIRRVGIESTHAEQTRRDRGTDRAATATRSPILGRNRCIVAPSTRIGTRQWREREGRLERAVAEDQLHVLHRDEEEAEVGEEQDRDADGADGEVGLGRTAGRREVDAAPQFDERERDRERHAGGHATPDDRMRPSRDRGLDRLRTRTRQPRQPIRTAPIQSSGVALSSRDERMVHVQMNKPIPAAANA